MCTLLVAEFSIAKWSDQSVSLNKKVNVMQDQAFSLEDLGQQIVSKVLMRNVTTCKPYGTVAHRPKP